MRRNIFSGWGRSAVVAIGLIAVVATAGAVDGPVMLHLPKAVSKDTRYVANVRDLTKPAEIFATVCTPCHRLSFLPTMARLSHLTQEQIEYALWNGPMQEYANGLDSGQRTLLAQWIAGLNGDKFTGDAGVAACVNPAVWTPTPATDWPGWSADATFTRSVDNSTLTVERVSKTELSWALPLPIESVFEGAANPVIVVGNRMFAANNNHWVYALNPDTGCAYWTYRAEGRVRSNVAEENGILAFGDLNANAYAMDAANGTLLWQRRVEASPGARVTGNVTIHNGVVYVPVSFSQEINAARPDVACCSARGSIVALDAKTGERKWKASMIDQPLKYLGKTPGGTNRFGPAGVSIFSGISADDKRGLVYVTTGNQWSEPRVATSDSVIALDMKTGAKRWVASLAPEEFGRQDIYHFGCERFVDAKRATCSPANPQGKGDMEFAAPAALTKLADGRELVLAGSKDAMFYALDPDSGKVEWQLRLANSGGAGAYGFATDGKRAYFPLPGYDEVTQEAHGSIFAIDLLTGKVAWRVDAPKDTCKDKPTPPCNNAYLTPPTLVGDVLFIGNTDGYLRAYSRNDGRLVWEFDTAREYQGINGRSGKGGSLGFGGPVVVGNRIYIMSGHSFYGLGMPGNVLLSFKVPEAP